MISELITLDKVLNQKQVSLQEITQMIIYCVNLNKKEVSPQEIQIFMKFGKGQDMIRYCINTFVTNKLADIMTISYKGRTIKHIINECKS